MYFPLTAFHPDQPEREQGEDVSAVCALVNALSSVCEAGCGYFYTSIVCMCASLPFGSMYSALVLTGPGDMKLTTAGLLDSAALSTYQQNLPLFRTLTYGPWSTILAILHLGKLRQKKETQSSSPRRPMADHLWFWPDRQVRVNTQKGMIKTEHLWAEDTVGEEEWTRATASQLN